MAPPHVDPLSDQFGCGAAKKPTGQTFARRIRVVLLLGGYLPLGVVLLAGGSRWPAGELPPVMTVYLLSLCLALVRTFLVDDVGGARSMALRFSHQLGACGRRLRGAAAARTEQIR